MSLAILLGLALVVPPHATRRAADSIALESSLRNAEFLYMMDWRHEWRLWRTAATLTARSLDSSTLSIPLPPEVVFPGGVCVRKRFDQVDLLARQRCMRGATQCDPIEVYVKRTNERIEIPIESEEFRYDANQHECLAHIVRAPIEWKYSLTPFLVLPVDTEPSDEAFGIDDQLPPSWRDTVRARRAVLLRRLDSAAAMLPGDRWLAGQRVRLYVDQHQTDRALAAATACRAGPWWCTMLRGYVRSSVHDTHAALATFDSGRRQMPADTLCRWDDVSALLIYTARTAYSKMSCAAQATFNARIWWLADPLYLLPDNERRAEHYAREMLGVLHSGLDVDERFDMRDLYNGPAVKEMVLRYGWPTAMLPAITRTPPGWSRFDTHDVYLGATPPIRYWGPEYHTIPTWATIQDPLHATADSWALGPTRYDSTRWDFSWWAPEFYRRTEGPLVDLATQIGFIRRHGTAAIVAAAEWQTDVNFLKPPARAIVGVATSSGPAERMHVASAEMDGAHPRAILTPVESGPILLGVEMVPNNDVGAAGRTRFGVSPPEPLRQLAPGAIALSDALLLHLGPGEDVPSTVQGTLTHMYGSTRLVNPGRIGVFWEVYGQADHDTVDVAVRVIRADDSNLLGKAGSLVGIGHSGPDTLTIAWREPRAGDAAATVDSGATIRPRGEVIDFSSQPGGDYGLTVTVTRRGVAAQSNVRTFTIVRR